MDGYRRTFHVHERVIERAEKDRAVNGRCSPKLHTWFKTGDSKFGASNSMIDLNEGCYGRGETAISLQRQNIEAYIKTLGDQTVMGAFAKQLKLEFETVQAHLEHVYACPQTKPFLLIELCQKLADQVGTFDQFLIKSEINRTLADQEANQQPVTLSIMLQMIEREQGIRFNEKTSSGLSSEVSEASAEKKQALARQELQSTL